MGELEAALNTPQCDCLAKGLGKGEEIWDRHTVSSMFSILHLCSYLQHLFHSYLCMDVSYVSIFLMCFFFPKSPQSQLVGNVETGFKVKTPGA